MFHITVVVWIIRYSFRKYFENVHCYSMVLYEYLCPTHVMAMQRYCMAWQHLTITFCMLQVQHNILFVQKLFEKYRIIFAHIHNSQRRMDREYFYDLYTLKAVNISTSQICFLSPSKLMKVQNISKYELWFFNLRHGTTIGNNSREKIVNGPYNIIISEKNA